MNIAIIGTRGIPNMYGGFEQFAEKTAPALAERGHQVTVYCSSLHPYQQSEWQNVRLVHCTDPENKIGTAGQFIYDLNCILHARQQPYDIILQLGYTSSSIWNFLFRSRPVLITNMDGLEWKRSKYNRATRWFLKRAERLAVKHSDALIADSRGIQDYLSKEYGVASHYIAYGSHIAATPDAALLKPYSLGPYGYNIVVARLEPENNIEMVIRGHLAQTHTSLVIVGNTNTRYGRYLKTTYASPRIMFTEGIYDATTLDALRQFSNLYFHGHSVGGTNPSLLEAMGCGCMIVAHDNPFNRGVLGSDALYFEDADAVETLLSAGVSRHSHPEFPEANLEKIRSMYTWTSITDQLEALFHDAIQQHA